MLFLADLQNSYRIFSLVYSSNTEYIPQVSFEELSKAIKGNLEGQSWVRTLTKKLSGRKILRQDDIPEKQLQDQLRRALREARGFNLNLDEKLQLQAQKAKSLDELWTALQEVGDGYMQGSI